MNKLKTFFKINTLLIISFFIFSTNVLAVTPKEAVCEGAGITDTTGTGCAAPVDSPSVDNVILTGLNIFTAIVGIIAVVMIIIGGTKYMTSQGDPGKTGEAKNTVMYAAIGLVIVALSQIIVRFVLRKFTT